MRSFACGLLVALLAVAGTARADSMPSPSPSATRQSLEDAWWTGPLLAPSAGTLPHGHMLVEPYLFDVIQYAGYDSHGTKQPAPHANTYGNLTYIIYGLTDRFNVGLIPTFSYTSVSGGSSSSRIGIGDWSLLAQYRLTPSHPGGPTASIAVQETFPTGTYDNLGSHPSDGFGSGAYSTKVSLYTQTYFWMPNGRILRARLNLSDSFSNAVKVDGASVYGTPNTFHGYAYPGNSWNIDAAAEYSVTRNWVLATDLVYNYAADTRVMSASGFISNSGDSHWFAFAPAIEYNWSSNLGMIAGIRLFPAGVNTSASITPVIAVNYVR